MIKQPHKILVGSCGVKPSVSISSNNEGSVTTHYHGLRSRIYFPINYWKQIKIGASEEFCHPIIGLEIRSPTFERHLQYMAACKGFEPFWKSPAWQAGENTQLSHTPLFLFILSNLIFVIYYSMFFL